MGSGGGGEVVVWCLCNRATSTFIQDLNYPYKVIAGLGGSVGCTSDW